MTWLDKILNHKGTGQESIIALAPMADMTDGPFCCVCREVSATPPACLDGMSGRPTPSWKEGDSQPFVIFREMVSAEAIVRGNKKTLKMCEFEEIERPIVIQLFGGKPEVIVEAAKILVGQEIPPGPPLQRGVLRIPDGIDINMGCPVPKIAGKGQAGASLMKDPERATAIVKALKQANLGVPISVKTRLGWAVEDEILTFAKLLEEAGVDALSIHGRTKKQGYTGQANWEMIGKVKKLLKIPVIANGDINSAEDIEKCLEVTGADGVMIGRGALGNPWIFSSVIARSDSDEAILAKWGIATPHSSGARNDINKVVLRHAELHLARYGEENGLKTFRKHLLCYFKSISGVKEIRKELVKIETLDELKKVLEKF
ncbi:MAG: tRNA-dihydrouridine synthase [Candidatus Magasanikbacteria bacterium GW2011_GWC2_37_14]|uniref:tRNA-dihydrouridine synthase n=1 Tax=Candidatus Magasanikbacteria bacterium GW2011_GWC2_37_14 TaxID=1619046 RepID=A0A0G0JH62_9BACT|nr:MAG: tRNA-dihydrouridine synthase [Candidatus Magasanikbacteria bacterium GW2011_GWC2_37_14]